MIIVKCKKCGAIHSVAPGTGATRTMSCDCGASGETNWRVIDDGLVECPECGGRYSPGDWCHGRRL